jgi:hypothetical protein
LLPIVVEIAVEMMRKHLFANRLIGHLLSYNRLIPVWRCLPFPANR